MRNTLSELRTTPSPNDVTAICFCRQIFQFLITFTGPWWMFGTFDYDDSKWICTASLSELHCNRGFKIKIEDINFQTGVCTDCEERLILRDLRELCNDRRKCTAASDKKHPCLYRIQYALLSFYCTGKILTSDK